MIIMRVLGGSTTADPGAGGEGEGEPLPAQLRPASHSTTSGSRWGQALPAVLRTGWCGVG